MKRIAVLVEQQYQEMELWYPVYRLREAGYNVALVGPEKGKKFPSKLGYPAECDTDITEVSAADFDAVVIPGGFCPDYLRRSKAIVQFVADMAAANKPVAAICHGPWLLCSTPALKGRKATGFHSIRDDMVNAGAEWHENEVVVDGPIITSRTPDDLPAFMKALLEALGG